MKRGVYNVGGGGEERRRERIHTQYNGKCSNVLKRSLELMHVIHNNKV